MVFSKYFLRACLMLLLVIITLGGCKQTTVVIPKEDTLTNKVNLTLDDTIISIANQLAQYNKISPNNSFQIERCRCAFSAQGSSS